MAKAKLRQDSSADRHQQRGATFSVRLADGRFGACRVLRVEPQKQDGMSLVAATQYVGDRPPDLSEPLLASILLMNSVGCHKAQRIMGYDFPCVWWQHWQEPPPAEFQYLGVLKPAPVEERMNPDSYSRYWENWAKYILQEWRWRNDQKAFIADYDRIYGAGWVRSVLAEKKRLADLTLPRLRRKRYFSEWDGFVPAKVIRESRKIVKETIDGLIALGSKPTKKTAVPILRHSIERFNSLADHINTIERENILEVFYEIVRVAGVKGCDHLAEKSCDF